MKSFKHITSCLCIAALLSLFSQHTVAAKDPGMYADVPTSHWAYSSIAEMTKQGIFQGTGTSNGQLLFSPEKAMTRAEFITAVTRLLYSDELASMPSGDTWYSNNYSLAIQRGLLVTEEFEGGNLNQVCTRQEMAMILTRATYNLSGEASTEMVDPALIPDYSAIEEYYQPFVRQTYSLGLLGGVDKQGTFNPAGTLNRAQAATIIYRLIDPSSRIKNDENKVTYTWQDGTTYVGAVKDGQANGYGEMTFPDIGTYKGNFVNGRREGIGTFSWLVGDTYVGQWNRDKQNGNGTYTFADGYVIRGVWSDNQISTNAFYMEPSSAVTSVGEQIYLVARVEPEMVTDAVSWSTSNDRVAAINSTSNFCVVTAIKKGTATITAKTASGKTTTCSITVDEKEIPIRKLELSQGDALLNISEELVLSPTFTPSNPSNSSLVWSSSDRLIATVNSGVVTGRRAGTAIISAKTRSGIVATCYVTVVDPNANIWEGYWGVYRSDSSGNKEAGWVYGPGRCEIDYPGLSADIYITSNISGVLDLTEENSYTLSGTLEKDGTSYFLTFTSINDDMVILEVESVDDTLGYTTTNYYIMQK